MTASLNTRQWIALKSTMLGTKSWTVFAKTDISLWKYPFGIILVASKVSSTSFLWWSGTSLELVSIVLVNVHGPSASTPFVSVARANTVASCSPDSLSSLSNLLATEALGSCLHTREWEASLLAVPSTFHGCVLATGSVSLGQNPLWIILEATKMFGTSLGGCNLA